MAEATVSEIVMQKEEAPHTEAPETAQSAVEVKPDAEKGDAPAPLSKNAQKRLRKQAAWEQKREVIR